MDDRKKRLESLIGNLEQLIYETNDLINKIGECDKKLYDAIVSIQEVFDRIRNVSDDMILKYEKIKSICLSWKNNVEKIEEDYNTTIRAKVGYSAAGTSFGISVATLGPWAAMGVATSFGTASTGTAISLLSGAAAKNAALAWLGGGAIAAGGGGMAAGNAFLALAGPVGWGLAAVSLLTGGLFFWKTLSDKHKLEDLFILISLRDSERYRLTIVEMRERINRMIKETENLYDAIREIKSFGTNYNMMTEKQQYALGCYLNLMLSSTQLLINPIMGLQPNVTFDDVRKYIFDHHVSISNFNCYVKKNIILYLANMLYKIDMDRDTAGLLMKSFRKNEDLQNKMGFIKNDFDMDIYDFVHSLLEHKS